MDFGISIVDSSKYSYTLKKLAFGFLLDNKSKALVRVLLDESLNTKFLRLIVNGLLAQHRCYPVVNPDTLRRYADKILDEYYKLKPY